MTRDQEDSFFVFLFVLATSVITKRGSLLTVLFQSGILQLSITGRLEIISRNIFPDATSDRFWVIFFLESARELHINKLSILDNIISYSHVWFKLLLLILDVLLFLDQCTFSLTLVGSFWNFSKFHCKLKLIVDLCSSIIESCSTMEMDDQHFCMAC